MAEKSPKSKNVHQIKIHKSKMGRWWIVVNLQLTLPPPLPPPYLHLLQDTHSPLLRGEKERNVTK